MNELIGQDTKIFRKAILLHNEMHATYKKEMNEDTIIVILFLSAIFGGILSYFTRQIVMIDELVSWAIGSIVSILLLGYLWSSKTRNLKKELDKLRSDFIIAYETSLETDEEVLKSKGIPNKEEIEKVYLFFLKNRK